MKKICQSCGMPIQTTETFDNRGTEKDNGRTDQYCYLCYRNGEFTEPNITYEEMLKRGKEGIKNSKENKFKKKLFTITYPSLLKKTDRWKK